MPISTKSIIVAALFGATSVAVAQNANDCYNLGSNVGYNDLYNDICNSAYSAIIKKEAYNPDIIHSFVIGVSTPSTGYYGCGQGQPREFFLAGYERGYNSRYGQRDAIYEKCYNGVHHVSPTNVTLSAARAAATPAVNATSVLSGSTVLPTSAVTLNITRGAALHNATYSAPAKTSDLPAVAAALNSTVSAKTSTLASSTSVISTSSIQSKSASSSAQSTSSKASSFSEEEESTSSKPAATASQQRVAVAQAKEYETTSSQVSSSSSKPAAPSKATPSSSPYSASSSSKFATTASQNSTTASSSQQGKPTKVARYLIPFKA